MRTVVAVPRIVGTASCKADTALRTVGAADTDMLFLATFGACRRRTPRARSNRPFRCYPPIRSSPRRSPSKCPEKLPKNSIRACAYALQLRAASQLLSNGELPPELYIELLHIGGLYIGVLYIGTRTRFNRGQLARYSAMASCHRSLLASLANEKP